MIDLTKTIAAKSDQLNSDDLIGGGITVKITSVSILAGDQPVAVSYEGDNGKPWKPCKSMRRVMVNLWGGDASKYTGRMMTLYRDPAVSFGGQAVGGIRISHMSDIDKPAVMSLTAAKNNKKQFTVKPLVIEQQAPVINEQDLMIHATSYAKKGTDNFRDYWKSLNASQREVLKPYMDMLKKTAESVDDPFKAESDAKPESPLKEGQVFKRKEEPANENAAIEEKAQYIAV